MKEIPLTQGKTAFVDDADYEWLSSFDWFAQFDGYNWYAKTKLSGGRGIAMHTLLCGDALRVDHRDRNGLNNQRNNLRPCTHQENIRNQGIKHKRKSAGYKGVCWSNRLGKWVAQIKTGQRVIHLGCFLRQKDAALAYDAAAIGFFGEFAATNRDLGLIEYKGDPIAPIRYVKPNRFGFVGVAKFGKRWIARITVEGKRKTVGVFDSPEFAAKAYDAAINQLIGKEAITNERLGRFKKQPA